MTFKQDLHLAYVIHTRAYRESSLLVELLSSEHGRVALVARGAKRGKAQASRLLQPFIPLNISWFGSGELVTLADVDAYGIGHDLRQKKAVCGIYLNELLIKLVPKWDPCVDLFSSYQQALLALANNELAEQVILRKFEVQLLKSLGYGLQLKTDVITGAAIQADRYYMFDPIAGPKLTHAEHVGAIKGKSLLALAVEDFTDAAVLLDIKRLMRIVLHHHLGVRQLKSRELLQ